MGWKKVRLIRGMEWNGNSWPSGTVFTIESPSYWDNDHNIAYLCCGHGTYEPLKIGVDAEIVYPAEDLV